MSDHLDQAVDTVYQHKNKALFLDTETTGLSIEEGDRIIEIGVIICDKRVIDPDEGKHYHRYLNPDREVPQDVIEVHGITNEYLASMPRFEDIVDEFIDLIRGQVLFIHNAEFDAKFLNMELARLGREPLESYAIVIDTLELGRAEHPGRLMTLDNMCRLYSVDRERTWHGALLDSLLLAECWLSMTGGQQAIDIDKLMREEPVPFVGLERAVRAVAPEEDLKEHTRILNIVEKNSKATALWRQRFGDEREGDPSAS